MARQINDEGLNKIKGWECKGGVPNLVAYVDSGGVLTIGYGHTGPNVRAGMTVTAAEAERLLRNDLAWAQAVVETKVKVPLADNQFAALTSFAFNVGAGAFTKSSLLKKLNAGDYSAVPKELMKWNRDNGKVVAGLTNRRAAECGLWAKDAPVSSAYVDVEARPVKGGIKIANVGNAVAGISIAAGAAADKLQPIADHSAWVMKMFIGLTVLGVIGGIAGGVYAHQQDKATV